jgi:aspartyl-tRNA(Asn)/glutamyl-tRNA(Gln) amidotransferase subunit A
VGRWANCGRIVGRVGGGGGGAGLVYAAIGTDTAGSIREPAALCGCVGLKPTYGRVSSRGVIPLSWSLDHVGPLAATVEDAAIVLQAIAGYDAADIGSVDVPVTDYVSALREGAKGMRVGVARGYFFDDIDAEVAAAMEQALRVIVESGRGVERSSARRAGRSHAAGGGVVRGSRGEHGEESGVVSGETVRRIRTGEASFGGGIYSAAAGVGRSAARDSGGVC